GGREAAHRLDHRSEPGPIAIGAVLAPTRDASKDETGIVGGQDVPAETPFLERAGQVVLDQDVGATAKPSQERLPARVGEIQGDRALAARVHLPPQLPTLAEPGAQRIAAARVLDLDDVRAVVGQDGREDTPGDQARAGDDAEGRARAAHCGDGALKARARASTCRARAAGLSY